MFNPWIFRCDRVRRMIGKWILTVRMDRTIVLESSTLTVVARRRRVYNYLVGDGFEEYFEPEDAIKVRNNPADAENTELDDRARFCLKSGW